jgi:hypothetical protein
MGVKFGLCELLMMKRLFVKKTSGRKLIPGRVE